MATRSTLLKGGVIADGTGSPSFRGDLLIADGLVAEVALSIAAADSFDVVDCTDRVIAPGFVDLHSHSDISLLAYPGNQSRVSQGITTELVGNCGTSPAPGFPDDPDLTAIVDMSASFTDIWGWSSLQEWTEVYRTTPIATNIALQMGHNVTRYHAAGSTGSWLDEEQLERQERQLREALDAGCVGGSFGLMYAPGQNASREELVRFASVLAERDALLSVHMREYSASLVEAAVREIIEVAESAGCRLQISHLRRLAKDGSIEPLLDIIESYQDRVDVTADIYPYTSGLTTILQLLPTLRAAGAEEVVQIAKSDPARIRRELESGFAGPEAITIMEANATKEAIGKKLTALGDDPWGAAIELIIENRGLVAVAVVGSLWGDVDAAYLRPWVFVASDGIALSPEHDRGLPHPRSWGTFPAAFRRMQALGIPLEESVRKMSTAPAARIHLEHALKPGLPGNVVVFDPELIDSAADYENPVRKSSGIDHVFVNGSAVLAGGEYTASRPGQLLEGNRNE